MLSRIADSMYWLSRYMERIEGLLRLTSIHYSLSLDKDVHRNINWKPALEIFSGHHEQADTVQNDTEAVLRTLLMDTGNTNSLKSLINKARENARGVQDHITKEVWAQVNQMYHMINQPAISNKLNAYEAPEVMEQLKKHTVSYAGITNITMPRGEAWEFMNLGKYMERCFQTIIITEKEMELVNLNEEATNDIFQWRHLLLSLSGYELHLKTYRSANHNANVIHQIIFNEHFAHSVSYSLHHIHIYLSTVLNRCTGTEVSNLQRQFGRLYSKVKYYDPESLDNKNIQVFLSEIKSDLLGFSKLFGQHFFSYS